MVKVITTKILPVAKIMESKILKIQFRTILAIMGDQESAIYSESLIDLEKRINDLRYEWVTISTLGDTLNVHYAGTTVLQATIYQL